jgi:hypothetical protein
LFRSAYAARHEFAGDQAVKDAQKKADELMRPYVERTSLKLP